VGGVKKHVVCMIFIKSVLYNFVVVWYIGDEYEESYMVWYMGGEYEESYVVRYMGGEYEESYECLYYQKEDVCFYIVYEL
jgi:hypothetical protein